MAYAVVHLRLVQFLEELQICGFFLMQSYLWWRSHAISIWTCLCFGKFHVCTFNPCSSSSIWWTNEDSVCVCLGVVFIIGTCTRLHAHGAMRRFSLNFDRMLERAIRHSPLHKKVSYIVPDKIHELYQVNVCEYASLVYWSIFQRPKQNEGYISCAGFIDIQWSFARMCALFVVFEQLSSTVNYTAEQMCLLCNKSSSCQGRECRERERESAKRERERCIMQLKQ